MPDAESMRHDIAEMEHMLDELFSGPSRAVRRRRVRLTDLSELVREAITAAERAQRTRGSPDRARSRHPGQRQTRRIAAGAANLVDKPSSMARGSP